MPQSKFIPVITHIVIIIIIITTIVLLTTDNDHLPHSFYPLRKRRHATWQFLYSMLTNVDGKYHNLIEWTHTARERQFRLLEPDAIAVWWGHHKNKPNMSYDKLSRSLRYYYDKGIIRKISGERFVYRFCIDPEVMYKHMGTSNARPKLKPMPQDAKIILSKDRNMRAASACIAKEPETLLPTPETKVESIPQPSLHPTQSPPAIATHSQSQPAVPTPCHHHQS